MDEFRPWAHQECPQKCHHNTKNRKNSKRAATIQPPQNHKRSLQNCWGSTVTWGFRCIASPSGGEYGSAVTFSLVWTVFRPSPSRNSSLSSSDRSSGASSWVELSATAGINSVPWLSSTCSAVSDGASIWIVSVNRAKSGWLNKSRQNSLILWNGWSASIISGLFNAQLIKTGLRPTTMIESCAPSWSIPAKIFPISAWRHNSAHLPIWTIRSAMIFSRKSGSRWLSFLMAPCACVYQVTLSIFPDGWRL